MTKKILIIEDDEENLKLFSTILRHNGHVTLEAKNGMEGIRLAMVENPNLILVDVHMPVMNGFEVLKIIKSKPSTKNIPVIALSAYPLSGARNGFPDGGFADCVVKPIILKEFIRLIEKHLQTACS